MAIIIAAFMTMSPVNAAPQIPLDKTGKIIAKSEAPEFLVKVKGCHGQKAYHWVKKWGKKAWHKHGYNCKPKWAKKKKWGGHCHRGLAKHWHKGHGKHWHKHKGSSCWYKSGKKKYYNNDYDGGNGCIKVGKVWICA